MHAIEDRTDTKTRPSIKLNKAQVSPDHPVLTLPHTPNTCMGGDTCADSRDNVCAYRRVDKRACTRIDV